MKTLRQVEVSSEFTEFIPEAKNMIQNVVYISNQYHTSSHLCLCGCGELVAMPLNTNVHPTHGWDYDVDDKERLSFIPSVGNYQIPCKSHYIITKGKANFV